MLSQTGWLKSYFMRFRIMLACSSVAPPDTRIFVNPAPDQSRPDLASLEIGSHRSLLNPLSIETAWPLPEPPR